MPASAASYVFSTFKGDAAALEKLSIYTSTDGDHFSLLSDTGFGGPTGTLRDPSIFKSSDGKYYVAYTDPPTASCCGKEDHFSIAVSTDLVKWSNWTTVSAGVPRVAHTWAPEWFDDGGVVKVIANIDTLNTDSDFKPYIFTALDSALTSWSGPVPLGIGPNYIDTFVLESAGTYHVFAKNETTRYCEHATASALTGPWHFVGTGDWAGWGSGMEGPNVVQLDDGTWRIFLDGQGSVGFLTATSSDLDQWSATTPLPGLTDIVRHGTVIRDVPAGSAPSTGGAAGSTNAAGGGNGGATGESGAPSGGGQIQGGAGATSGSVSMGGTPAAMTGSGGDLGAAGGRDDGGTPSAQADGGSSTSPGTPSRGASARDAGGCSCRMPPEPKRSGPPSTWLVLAAFSICLRIRSAVRKTARPSARKIRCP